MLLVHYRHYAHCAAFLGRLQSGRVGAPVLSRVPASVYFSGIAGYPSRLEVLLSRHPRLTALATSIDFVFFVRLRRRPPEGR